MHERSKKIRLDIIKLSQANGGYHYGGSFSCVEILIALFDNILRSNDKFIMSKGHACWGYYVFLREQGFDPLLEGHPHIGNGVQYTTGSMGHGFPAAVGMALARKIKKESGKVYVLIGDGESQEGTTWESLLIGAHHKLDNLVVIVDNNLIQGSNFVSEILPAVNVLKIAALSAGWDASVVGDGHNINELVAEISKDQSGPKLVVCDTEKGHGVSFMANKPAWHAKFLDPEHEQLAIKELT